MTLLSLEMNGQSIMDEKGDIDWGFVKNAPSITITSNAHSHLDRYYAKADVDKRITSLALAIDNLETKITNLFTEK